jgi:hypothetical protein
MRDNLKNLQYFNDFINEDSARIEKFTNKLINGEVKEERIIPVKSKVHELRIGLMIARYSRGDEVSILEEEYLKLLSDWEEVWKPEYYNKNLKMISLAVLFNIDTGRAKKIKDMLEKSNIQDWLLNYFLHSLDSEIKVENKKLIFPNDFTTLQRVVFEEDKIELLKRYLTKEWYNEDCDCYEAHKSKQNIYYGYWSFEAGAIAKILGLDDSELKDVQHYPYDLVHYSDR